MSDQVEIVPQSAGEANAPENAETRNVINNNTNSLRMNEVVGASFLGILCLILLVSLLRSQERNRRLSAELARLLHTGASELSA